MNVVFRTDASTALGSGHVMRLSLIHILPFHYNNFPELETLVREHDIGVIKMEVSRNTGPQDGFLHKVRKLATDRNSVLIFDECTSGFRQTFGGLHKLYGVEPDVYKRQLQFLVIKMREYEKLRVEIEQIRREAERREPS